LRRQEGETGVHDLSNFTLADMARCGAALRKAGDGARSFEEAAGRVVRHLHDQLRAADGGRACVLVRFFKTHGFGDLPEPLRAAASRLLAEPPRPEMKCLTLMGTAGDMPAWNSRHTSAGHQAVPLAGPEALARLPMVAQLIHQFGLDAELLLPPPAGWQRPSPARALVDGERKTYNVFYVAEAAASPFVPAQLEFVEPFGVRSVLAFGGLLPAGDLFAVVLFSRVPVARETAEMFKPLALNVKLAVLPFQGAGRDGPVFAPDDLLGAG
jgi:hypothetical protein